MIKLTKLNKELIIINASQIESIEIIPESKIIMMNKDYFIVRESVDEIIEKTLEFSSKIFSSNREVTVKVNNLDID